jgi:aryl-alcohol dehydrogenase-like predicted oxidoreductase
MKIIFGASHMPCLMNQNLHFSKIFLDRLISDGFIRFDTAESYCYGNSEKILGSMRRNDLIITTKVGGNYQMITNSNSLLSGHRFKSAISKYEIRVLQKFYQVQYGLIPQFNPFLFPKMLKKRLEKSLKRLNRDYVDNYLLHGVPEHLDLDYFVEEMISIRNAGYVKKIGISYNGDCSIDLNWADMIQVPFDKANKFKHISSEISAYGVFINPENQNINNLRSAIKNTSAKYLVVRSTNILHLQEIANLFDS